MVQVRFTTFEHDHERDEWVEELVAGGDEVTISGPHADWISPDISIVDPESGEPIRRSQAES